MPVTPTCPLRDTLGQGVRKPVRLTKPSREFLLGGGPIESTVLPPLFPAVIEVFGRQGANNRRHRSAGLGRGVRAGYHWADGGAEVGHGDERQMSGDERLLSDPPGPPDPEAVG